MRARAGEDDFYVSLLHLPIIWAHNMSCDLLGMEGMCRTPPPPEHTQSQGKPTIWQSCGQGYMHSSLCQHQSGLSCYVMLDSACLILGAQGKMCAWQNAEWVTTAGRLSNVPVWEQLIDVAELTGTKVMWIHSLGHLGLEGNKIAHRLLVEGMCLNQLWSRERNSFLEQNETMALDSNEE